MKSNIEITHELLTSVLDYSKETGQFTWKIRTSNRIKVGDRADNDFKGGYKRVCLFTNQYAAHRIAWFYVYGVWPTKQIDHIDGVPSNNRIDNLREATNQQNSINTGMRSNNTSGFRGVTWHKIARKWMAHTRFFGKEIYLGLHETAESASAAYEAKATELFGEFKRQQKASPNCRRGLPL
jgi:hypothetical protein